MGVPYAEVIGDPIAHSKSPLIHKFWLEKLGIAADYRTHRLSPADLPAYLAARRQDPDWRGCNVTLPFKQAVLPHLDLVEPESKRAGAVNTVVNAGDKLFGFNTDILYLKYALLPHALETALMELTAVVFGAGGAARAVLDVLGEADGIQVALFNRTRSKAEALLAGARVKGRHFAIGRSLPATNLIVNASSLGMTGYPPLPIDLADVSSALVCDLVYSPVETDLLRQARTRGLVTVDGLTVLIGQARPAFRHFFSFSPPSGSEMQLRQLLTS